MVLAPTTEDEGDDAEDERAIVADLVWAACGEVVDASRDRRSGTSRDTAVSSAAGSPCSSRRTTRQTPRRTNLPRERIPAAIGSLRWPGAPLYFVGAYASLSVRPAAATPAGHRMAALAVIAAMRTHARRVAAGDPYAVGLTEAQTREPAVSGDVARDDAGVPLKWRPCDDAAAPRVDGHEGTRATRRRQVNMRELTEYQIVDEEFILEVRLKLPEAVPPSRVRSLSRKTARGVCAGKVIWREFFIKAVQTGGGRAMLARGVDEEEESLRDSAQVR